MSEGFLIYFDWGIYYLLYGAENIKDQISRSTNFLAVECRGKYRWNKDVLIVKGSYQYAEKVIKSIQEENRKRRVERNDIPIPIRCVEYYPNGPPDIIPMPPNNEIKGCDVIPLSSHSIYGIIITCDRGGKFYYLLQTSKSQTLVNRKSEVSAAVEKATEDDPLVVLGIYYYGKFTLEDWDRYIIFNTYSRTASTLLDYAKLNDSVVIYNNAAVEAFPSLLKYPRLRTVIQRLEALESKIEEKIQIIPLPEETNPKQKIDEDVKEEKPIKLPSIYSPLPSFNSSQKK